MKKVSEGKYQLIKADGANKGLGMSVSGAKNLVLSNKPVAINFV